MELKLGEAHHTIPHSSTRELHLRHEALMLVCLHSRVLASTHPQLEHQRRTAAKELLAKLAPYRATSMKVAVPTCLNRNPFLSLR